MRLPPERLESHLEGGLAPLYLLCGDEPLLIEESCDVLRAAARRHGCEERVRHTVEPRFDWDALQADVGSLSLFSSRRLVEVRMPTGRPGEAGARVIGALAASPPGDVTVVLIAGSLERGVRQAKWVKEVERAGAVIEHRAVEAARLPAWLASRFRARGVTPAPGVTEALAWYLEGNLLAAAQEVDRLALTAEAGRVTMAAVEDSAADRARFSVFALADACVAGDAARAARTLQGLRVEGTEPVLMLWALTRELRPLARMSRELVAGKPLAEVMRAAGVWQRRQPLVKAALSRHNYRSWLALLRRAAHVDRVLKGRRPGNTGFELERLVLAMAGAAPPAARPDNRKELFTL